MMKIATATTLIGCADAYGKNSFRSLMSKSTKASGSKISKASEVSAEESSPQLSLDDMLKNKIDMQEMMKMMPDMLAKFENMTYEEYKEHKKALPVALRSMLPKFNDFQKQIGGMKTELEQLASNPDQMKMVEEQIENLKNDPKMAEIETVVKNGDMGSIENMMKEALHEQDELMGDLKTDQEEDEDVEKVMDLVEALKEMGGLEEAEEAK